ncbi:unnamed protein product [Acanthoscelides obtectus]|uniref:Uncharacterized protein n=1 Tax=Acanthoscelides obtectus TaxID=200917 RepID=A0A9P0M3Z3_ACAOB|nr:unnamed protein product [Acanthoscelides obtectus]CAK1624609.1 hypothetical protein AOBTE_LOCUS2643 [Acanthoscelides obtectus]
MMLALKNDCPHRTTIFRWYKEFQRGNFTLEDAEREGRPQTSVTEENITAILWTTYASCLAFSTINSWLVAAVAVVVGAVVLPGVGDADGDAINWDFALATADAFKESVEAVEWVDTIDVLTESVLAGKELAVKQLVLGKKVCTLAGGNLGGQCDHNYQAGYHAVCVWRGPIY